MPKCYLVESLALDATTGELKVAHGDTPDNVKNHPALKGVAIPRTRRQGQIETLVTKTLLIAGEGGVAMQPDGRRGGLLRAYDLHGQRHAVHRAAQGVGAGWLRADRT